MKVSDLFVDGRTPMRFLKRLLRKHRLAMEWE